MSSEHSDSGGFRSGYVTIVGRPNVGKSTLVNAILGQKVAIVTPKPQTTRDRIHGIRTDATSQIVFVDTPGIHKPFKKLNQAMVDRAVAALQDVDVVCFMIDAAEQRTAVPASADRAPADRAPADRASAEGAADGAADGEAETAQPRAGLPAGDVHVLEHVERAAKPTLLLINKVDRIRPKSALLPIIAAWKDAFPFAAVVPLSALGGENVSRVIDEIVGRLPEGPLYFDEDQITDRTERFLVAEIVREKVTLRTEKEIPYAIAVEIERWQDHADRFTEIHAVIHVERDSQKGIVIGKGGVMLKSIGIDARQDIERLLGHKVMLKLFVHVEPEWSEKNRDLKRFGYVD